jgi:tricorn protease-like protein
LWEAAVDPSTWKIQKPPRRLTTGSGRECNASLADDGRMVFASVHQNLNLWTLPVDANTGKVMGKAEALTRSDANSLRPSLSLDGRKLVFVSDRSGNSDIWFYDMETGKERALASTPWEDSHPYFTPDGSKIFYLTLEPSKQVINVLPLDTGVSERFCDDCGLPMAWSPDGKRIYFHRRDTAAGHWKSIDVVSRELANVFRHPKVYLGTLRISFDGKWLAGYLPTGPTEGRAPILVAPIRSSFVGESEWIEVTDGSGLDSTPWWSPDGGTLYFLSQRDGFVCIFTQSLDKVTKRPVGKPRAIAHFHGVQHTLRRVGFGPGVARDKLVFTMSETNANIWMTTIRSRE